MTTRPAGGGDLRDHPAPGGRTRWPRSVYANGEEPDPRFSLANERTFLAWLRTALALIAAGVALETVAPPIAPALRLVASVTVIALGILTVGNGWIAWARAERAMREARPLRGAGMAVVIGGGVAVVAGLLLVGLLLGHA